MKLRRHHVHEIDLRPTTLIELRRRTTNRTLDGIALIGGVLILGIYLLLA